MRYAGGFVTDHALITDAKRIGWVEICDAAILNVDRRNAVRRSSHVKGIIETDFLRTGRNRFIPIDFPIGRTQAKMPFADNACCIAIVS